MQMTAYDMRISDWGSDVCSSDLIAKRKSHLQSLLKQQFSGLVVTMIHKFDKADANLSTRDNVFVLIDEANRSTGGDLGNYLMGALHNATLIGFTGTPVDKTAPGKGTLKTFEIGSANI